VHPYELLVAATDELPATALVATAAASTQEAHADALSYSPSQDSCAEHVDHPDRLVFGHARRGDREHAVDRRRIGMAAATSLDADTDMGGRRISQRFSG
jgi:hypothetical protein